MEIRSLPLSQQMQNAEVASLAEFAGWTRSLTRGLLQDASALECFSQRPFLYIREPCRRVLWNRGSAVEATGADTLSERFHARAKDLLAEVDITSEPSSRLSTALASLVATGDIAEFVDGASSYLTKNSFPERDTAFEKVLGEIYYLGPSNNDASNWTHADVADKLRILMPPEQYRELHPVAYSNSYADFAEVLKQRRPGQEVTDAKHSAFAFLLAEHLLHWQTHGHAQTPPLGTLFVPLIFLGQYRAQLFWPFANHIEVGSCDEYVSPTAVDVATCLGRNQASLCAGLASKVLWAFSTVLRNQLSSGFSRHSRAVVHDAVLSTFSYLCVSDVVLFATVQDQVETVRAFGATDFREKKLLHHTKECHTDLSVTNRASIDYTVVNTPDVYIAVDLSLGDRWIKHVGFNHVRYIISAEALALTDKFFTNIHGRNDKVKEKMKETMWHVKFEADAFEVVREIESIGDFVEAAGARNTAEQALLNYDGIGHALRTFVEATGYRGALQLTRHIEHSEATISAQNLKRLRQVQQSLSAFEHAEGIGNLLRLHGWLNAMETDHEVVGPKILRCYDEEGMTTLDNDAVSTAVVDGYKQLSLVLAQFIAQHFSVEVGILGPTCIGLGDRILPGGDAASPIQEVKISGLHSSGDEGAVLLAMSVALLEPLRNAAVHVNRVADDAESTSPLVVLVLSDGVQGGCDVYIGNPLQSGATARIGESTSYGLRLVSKIVQQTRVASIVEGEMPVDVKRIQQDSGYSGNEWLWVKVALHPLSLFEHVKTSATT